MIYLPLDHLLMLILKQTTINHKKINTVHKIGFSQNNNIELSPYRATLLLPMNNIYLQIVFTINLKGL